MDCMRERKEEDTLNIEDEKPEQLETHSSCNTILRRTLVRARLSFGLAASANCNHEINDFRLFLPRDENNIK